MLRYLSILLVAIAGLSDTGYAQSVRIKELAHLRGDRTNSLIGFGLIVGLNKTGDTPTTFAKNKAVTNV